MEAVSSLEGQKIPYERRETFTTIVTEQLSLGSAATTAALDFDSQPSNPQNEQDVSPGNRRENVARRRESKEERKAKKKKTKKKKKKEEGTEIPLGIQRERLSSRDTSDSDDFGHEMWLDDCCTSNSSDWNASLHSHQSNPKKSTHRNSKIQQNSNISSLFFHEGKMLDTPQTASYYTATTDSITEHSIPLSSGQSTNYSITDLSHTTMKGDGDKDEISRDLLVSYMKAMGVELNFSDTSHTGKERRKN